ncbi:hypothetical protein [Pectinatus frisingensis]|uniref:hypothetical protein n=1 Tax=Pectinatus frisingensis TaxID=865 RepID=UPI0018C6DC76|nr:hypothetical protein [Pectinatus frisingensis]
MTDDIVCPICGNKAKVSYADRNTNIVCLMCGSYMYTADKECLLYDKERNNSYFNDPYAFEKYKCALFYYLRVIKKNYLKKPTILSWNSYLDIFAEPFDGYKFYDLYPKTFSKKIDMVMELLSTFIDDIGKYYPQNLPDDIVWWLALSKEQKDETIEILKELDYIKDIRNKAPHITFTPKGWGKIDSLQRNKKRNSVFIAMSFDWDNKEFPIGTCRDAIKEAISKAGYEPCIISEHQHNKSIPQEIENEIKKSEFVVTDLTTQNKGAYFEAGVAKGLGKEVIFTCHEDDFNNIHFDTKQINTIKWSDKNTFVDDLYKRIKFTIGEYSEIK